MLGRTAGGLFWMFRYLERAENIARLLETGWHISLTSPDEVGNEWESLITTTGTGNLFFEKHDTVDAVTVVNFLLRDKDNPSSVMSCMNGARNNARMVRTALSAQVWEATNEAWMDLKARLARPATPRSLGDTLDAIRNRTAQVQGALHGTMLRNDIFNFARLGTFVERLDNTARILDVKYYVLLPSAAYVGTSVDNAQWEVILRSVSAERALRWLNGGDVTPQGIAEFLILDGRMPRSMAFCTQKIAANLAYLEHGHTTHLDSQTMAKANHERLQRLNVQDMFDQGLHEVLESAVRRNQALALQIETDFRFNE